MARSAVVRNNGVNNDALVGMGAAPAGVNDAPAIRDFTLLKKKGWSVRGEAYFIGPILGMLPAAFICVMLSSIVGTGGLVGVAAAVVGVSIVAVERSYRTKEANFFKELFERDQLFYEMQREGYTRAATAVIEAMDPGISTDHFIGVMNNLFERKEIDQELRDSVNDNISNVAKVIGESIYISSEVARNMDNKAVPQFLLLNSVVDALMNDRTLLPQVDRQHLVTKFTEFSNRFVENCGEQYPKKMTRDIASRIRGVPVAHAAHLNDGGAAAVGVNNEHVVAHLNYGGGEVVAAAGVNDEDGERVAAPLAAVEVVGGDQLAHPPYEHGRG